MVDQQLSVGVELGPKCGLVGGEGAAHRHPKQECLDEPDRQVGFCSGNQILDEAHDLPPLNLLVVQIGLSEGLVVVCRRGEFHREGRGEQIVDEQRVGQFARSIQSFSDRSALAVTGQMPSRTCQRSSRQSPTAAAVLWCRSGGEAGAARHRRARRSASSRISRSQTRRSTRKPPRGCAFGRLSQRVNSARALSTKSPLSRVGVDATVAD